jgi:flagellar hook-associated protein 3 FlgL
VSVGGIKMRITTSMTATRYLRNLSKSESAMNYASEQVSSGRSFFKGSEDPISAIKTYKLRREYSSTEMYADNISDADSLLTSAESNLSELSDDLQSVYISSLKGITATMSADDREIIATELDAIQECVLSTLNAQYGDKYIFGGTSSTEVPFTVDDSGNLLYKGINVNSTDPDDLAKLDELSNETVSVDVGLGIELDENGDVKSSSVFDISLVGINIIGYGIDDEGLSNNLYSLIGTIKEQLRSDDFSYDDIASSLEKFSEAEDSVSLAITELGAKANYLDFLETRNDSNQDNLTESINEIEYVDVAEAATDYAMKEYSYEAALAMGSKILSNTIFDYMS